MPGITGIIGRTFPEKHKQDIGQMVNCMLHESFYESGTFGDDQMGVFAGWICHKDSFCDCMPVWNEKKNIVLIFFGENFTDLELFDELKAKHHRFDRSNASYIIHMYEEKGPDFLLDLNGWFCGILIDLQLSKIILFNDRYGMQKIFYYEGKNAFYFASEAKALLKVCPELRNLDMRSLGELMSCECVLENRTIFKNVFLLPPGSSWIFHNNDINKAHYFSPTQLENQTWLEKEFFYKKLRDTFVNILPRYFRGSQAIGISLTGGLDTRMLMSNADLPAGKYPCYTFASMYRDCNDVKVARRVAKATEQKHVTIPVDQYFLNHFNYYAEKTVYISDGYIDVSIAPEVFINKAAREIASVRMTGNLGSEVLRDIRWLKTNRVNERIFNPDFNVHISATSKTLNKIHETVTNPLTFTLFVETPWWGNNRLVSEQSQLTLRAPYLDNDLIALMYRAPMGARDSKDISLRLIADGNSALRSIPTDRGYGGKFKFPLSNMIRAYHEFFFKAEYAYNYGMPQWLAMLDYTFKFLHLEKIFLGRHKFAHFRLWYRDELAAYVRAILLDEQTLSRPYLNRNEVEYVVESHTKGYRNYTTEITQLLTLELIQRQLIEGSN
jgi:asparagine synthase (glutamine-hydrolysing)